MKKLLLVPCAVVLSLSLVGCGFNVESQEELSKEPVVSESLPVAEDIEGASTTLPEGSGDPNDPATSGIVAGEVMGYIMDIIHEDGSHEYKYAIVNQTPQVEKFTFNSGMLVDYTITDSNGEKVYQHSEEMMSTMAIVEKELKQGKNMEFDIELPEDLEAGTYTVEAWLNHNGENQHKETIEITVE